MIKERRTMQGVFRRCFALTLYPVDKMFTCVRGGNAKDGAAFYRNIFRFYIRITAAFYV